VWDRLKRLGSTKGLAIALAILVSLGIISFGATQSSARPTDWAANNQPRWETAWANPTNYGDRFTKDVYGQPVSNAPVVVLHETVASANSTIRFFQTPHPNEDQQASYHALVRRDGTIVYLVPFEKRAFGAGNSIFVSSRGSEAVKTHPKYSASVNNFAVHFSLETPANGNNNGNVHSGYTLAQYRSLAWLVAYTRIPDARITTHKLVDRSGTRKDPRSFSINQFWRELHRYQRAAKLQPNPSLVAGDLKTPISQSIQSASATASPPI
jgi:N-acetylmuramoyl-L-alanine amidase